ncbi:hypothetical protein AVEN_137841-1 [Araneus ventricosus]|uniref:Uncharacterized protein n=1 Tax=Araneus ventricosus TaxID=182803 RepID=A0A4Y2QTI2_ARAVE|nr:hypothetical protein AVEN_137841-1 [Araneus ventricosus]
MGYGVIYRDGSAVATSKDGVLWRSACGCGNTCGRYSPCRPNYAPAPRPRPPCNPCGGSSYEGPVPAPRPPCSPCGGSSYESYNSAPDVFIRIIEGSGQSGYSFSGSSGG